MWGENRSKWSTRLGSWFFRPLNEHGRQIVLGTNFPQLVVPYNQTKHENLKKVPRTDCSHLPSPPSVRNTFFDIPLSPHILVPSLIGLN